MRQKVLERKAIYSNRGVRLYFGIFIQLHYCSPFSEVTWLPKRLPLLDIEMANWNWNLVFSSRFSLIGKIINSFLNNIITFTTINTHLKPLTVCHVTLKKAGGCTNRIIQMLHKKDQRNEKEKNKIKNKHYLKENKNLNEKTRLLESFSSRNIDSSFF